MQKLICTKPFGTVEDARLSQLWSIYWFGIRLFAKRFRQPNVKLFRIIFYLIAIQHEWWIHKISLNKRCLWLPTRQTRWAIRKMYAKRSNNGNLFRISAFLFNVLSCVEGSLLLLVCFDCASKTMSFTYRPDRQLSSWRCRYLAETFRRKLGFLERLMKYKVN